MSEDTKTEAMQVIVKTNGIALNIIIESDIDVEIVSAVFRTIEKRAKELTEANETFGKPNQPNH